MNTLKEKKLKLDFETIDYALIIIIIEVLFDVRIFLYFIFIFDVEKKNFEGHFIDFFSWEL